MLQSSNRQASGLTGSEQPLQQEIISSWRGNPCTPTVSIICHAFNHGDYIETALRGFLAQKTDFPFEIIVHDDASTDGTREVILRYAQEYPLIVKATCQSSNQYSKGSKPSSFTFPQARGAYVALCEGDDYWVSASKLQMQVEALESEPGADFCFHSSYCIKGSSIENEVSWRYPGSRLLSVQNILQCKSGRFAPTCSYMVRSNVLAELPEWFYREAPVGDFFIEMYGTKRGGAIYLDEPLSVYRKMVPGSWSSRTTNSVEEFSHFAIAMIKAIDLLETDFPGNQDAFCYKRARIYATLAIRHLMTGSYISFADFIEKSASELRFQSRKQRIFYYLRRWPRGAHLLGFIFRVGTA